MHKCESEIERVRQQLIKTAQEYGMHSQITIELSCKLDLLINEYEKNKLVREE